MSPASKSRLSVPVGDRGGDLSYIRETELLLNCRKNYRGEFIGRLETSPVPTNGRQPFTTLRHIRRDSEADKQTLYIR